MFRDSYQTSLGTTLQIPNCAQLSNAELGLSKIVDLHFFYLDNIYCGKKKNVWLALPRPTLFWVLALDIFIFYYHVKMTKTSEN